MQLGHRPFARLVLESLDPIEQGFQFRVILLNDYFVGGSRASTGCAEFWNARSRSSIVPIHSAPDEMNLSSSN